uniref:Structure-specific endonuclease subunit SLX1 homolog n=1 Tax=Meloidogyne enterolobii TaxID=390850 RepID=A0A6V7VT70_MELEN|nr:unnamed protein product [Meloidogyne enterolobii]
MLKLLHDLSEPLVPPKETYVQDEFFGVYCLVSRSVEKVYKNRCYIGYTVDPNRRIRQHNSGREHGGAKKTDSKGPWDMVCIVHGFPNAISALQFEWAWQNPDKSKRLKRRYMQKDRKETPFAFRFRIVIQMLNTRPWRELALTFRWLIKEYEIPFNHNLTLPPHMKLAYGKVQKSSVLIPIELNAYTTLRDCEVCKSSIPQIIQALRCPAFEVCGAHFHASCLAERCLESEGHLEEKVFPVSGRCPRCAVDFLWGDVVRDLRALLLIQDSKPMHEGMKIADGLIPKKISRS